MRMLSPFTTTDWSWPRRSLSSDIVGDVWDDFDSIVNSLLRPTVARNENFRPAGDVKETKDYYLINFDMPGVKKEDISIEVKNNQLSISGERHHETGEGTESSKFERTFVLPTTVNVDKIEANYENGVLSVALPKAETEKGRTIQIKSGEGSFFSKLLGAKKEDQAKEIKGVKVS